MLYAPISLLLKRYGLKTSLIVLLLINAGLLSLLVQWHTPAVAVCLFAFNCYALTATLLLIDRDMRIINKLLATATTIEPTALEAKLAPLVVAASSGVLAGKREAVRLQQQHQDFNDEIGHSARELETSSSHLASNIHNQSTATSSIAAAVTEISHNVEDIAVRMKQACENADSANQLSHRGTQIIRDSRSGTEEVATLADTTYALLTSLDGNTQNVASISSVIREIAEQTNLLALNAAIEAARAGESGRGFAVVADEVRALANRSHESAQEISANIDDVKNQVSEVRNSMDNVVRCTEQSVRKAQEAEQVLNEITTNTNEVADSLFSISSATEQQTAAVQEISSNIEQVAMVADQNSEISKQSASIANHLRCLCA